MSFMKPPTPTPLPPVPTAPQAPPLMASNPTSQKPQPKSQTPTFLSEAMMANPDNTGRKNLTGGS